MITDRLTQGLLVPQDAGVTSTRSVPSAGARARLRRTPGGALLLKSVVFVTGLAFVVLGLVLVVAPGPLTIPPILLGLWIWSAEFAWAERQLDRATMAAREAWADARRRPVVSSFVTVGGLVALGVGVWAAGHYDLVARGRSLVGV